MNRTELTNETRKCLDTYNLPDWKVGFQKRSSRVMATTFFHPKEILFSTWYVDYNSPETVRKTILHEVAHAVVGEGHGHSSYWKRQARSMGLEDPKAVTDSKTLKFPEPAWQGVCGCGRSHARQRLSRLILRCTRCGAVVSWTREFTVGKP